MQLKNVKTSDLELKTDLIEWIKWVEVMDHATSSDGGASVQNSLNKFEKTAQQAVENAVAFPTKINATPPEFHQMMKEFENISKKLIILLADEMKEVVAKLTENTKP